GRFDLDAARSRGYEGAVDLRGFDAHVDPATGAPVFDATSGGAHRSLMGTYGDSGWGNLWGAGCADTVYALAVYNNNLIVAGFFKQVAGGAASRVAQWDGKNWFALGAGCDSTVFALTVYGGNLIAGGQFTNAGGSPAANIAQWNGTTWSAIGT